jgi:hypothetical protein
MMLVDIENEHGGLYILIANPLMRVSQVQVRHQGSRKQVSVSLPLFESRIFHTLEDWFYPRCGIT